jgi:threonine aldolase
LGESEEGEVTHPSTTPGTDAAPFFGSDNQSGVHPDLLAAFVAASEGFSGAYGDDPWTAAGARAVQDAFGGGEAFFVFNGTGGNVLALQSMLRSFEAVVCADMAHIADDECGAPEKVGGFKLLTAPTDGRGKLTVEAVARYASYRGSIHQPHPKVLSITQPTELGTVYTPDELARLASFARAQGWFVHVDGARLANAVVANGADFRAFGPAAGIDAVTLGGTKAGFAFGEAVVLFRPEHADAARFYRKQCLQLASKMRFVAAQFSRYFHDDLWKRIASHSLAMAARLEKGLRELGFAPAIARDANALFVKFPKAMGDTLAERFHFYAWPHGDGLYRLMTSFATTEAHVDHFLAAVRAAAPARR